MPSSISSSLTPRGNGELVLIVDDEPSVLAATKQAFETHGYRTLTARDGTEAILLAVQNENDITLVLTAMMMPVLDGLAMIQALAKLKPNLTFIGITGDKERHHEMRARALRASRFIFKPCTSEDLLQAIHDNRSRDF